MHLIKLLETSFVQAKDPTIAAQQSAYMRNIFRFFGIKKPLRAELQKEAFKAGPLDSEKELIKVVKKLWEKPEREYQMTAIDLAYRYKKLWTPQLLPFLEQLIRTKSWWDTVDTLAGKHVGTLLQMYPDLKETMDSWIKDENLWIRRSAIIYQLSYKEQTDHVRLFSYCQLRMHEKEFFIRKAIGWALRQYGKTNPDAVRAFVEKERELLSPLSYREARKYL